MERLVQFLFGHERAVFTNGQFGFDLRPHPALSSRCALLFAAFIYFVYVRPRARLRGRASPASSRSASRSSRCSSSCC